MTKIVTIIFLLAFYFNSFGQNLLTAEKLWELGRVSLEDVSPDGTKIIYGVTYYTIQTNKGNTDLFIMATDGSMGARKLTNYEGHEYNARFRPDGNKIAFLKDAELYEMNTDGSDQSKLSTQEMNGFIWSPKGDKIVFLQDVKYRKTTKEIYPDLPMANARIYNDLMYRHWKTWDDNHDSNVFYMEYSRDGSISKEATNIVKADFEAPTEPNDGIEQVAVSADGNLIAYSCKRLKGKEYTLSTNTDIFLYNIKTGSTKNVSEAIKGYDKSPVFSPDGKYLLWHSMSTPNNEADKTNLVLYQLSDGSSQVLTQQFNNEADNACFSKDGKSIYFICPINACKQIMHLDIATLQIKQLTQGIHDYNQIIPSTNQIIGAQVSMIAPAEIFSVHPSSGMSKQISQVNTKLWNSLKKAEVRQRWVKTTDGKQMLVWMILPPGFDAAKKYPTLLYCQGGPQSTLSQFFSYRWNFSLMAANGYIIIAPCRRGMPGFGQEWNLAISKDWGGQCMKDYLSAIDDASKETFVDKNQLGCIGASFGGYSAFWLAGNHQKRFKCFISHCGMFNNTSWYGTTEEMWFANFDLNGPYWDKKNIKQYTEFSPHTYVQNWDTPILIIHGEKDFRVPVSEGMQAYQAAQLRGIPSKLVLFPEEGHWIQTPQNSLLWQREFYSWLDKWLK
ncbi:MAG: S9 family peptidase [Bacteroidota bacterium]|nr:S9 family peptidase [Bacteroidota bacterium]